MPDVQLKKTAMMVDRILLMCSDRGKRGMIYTAVGELAANMRR